MKNVLNLLHPNRLRGIRAAVLLLSASAALAADVQVFKIGSGAIPGIPNIPGRAAVVMVWVKPDGADVHQVQVTVHTETGDMTATGDVSWSGYAGVLFVTPDIIGVPDVVEIQAHHLMH